MIQEERVSAPSESSKGLVGVPYEQFQSFVRHDIYAPTAMLRHFLQSMADIELDPESMRDTLCYAAGLTSELDWLLGLLVDALALAGDRPAPAQLEPTLLHGFLPSLAASASWNEASEVACLQAVEPADPREVLVDRGVLERALLAMVYQWSRMGSLPGAVLVTLDAADGTSVELHKTRGIVPADELQRAMEGTSADWAGFLRRLPACGLPLRVARGLLGAAGVEVQCLDDPLRGAVVRLVFLHASVG